MARTLHLDFTRSDRLDPRITFSRASSATRTNANGLIEVVPAGTPRRDFDPVTGVCKGLLIEEQRTNLLTYSEQFDNAAWGKSFSSVGANVISSPDGTITSDSHTETSDASAQYHSITRTGVSDTPGAVHTFSIYVKAGSRSYYEISPTSGAGVNFNLGTGSINFSYGTGVTGSITSTGNGWYRLSVSAVISSSTTNITLLPGGSNGATNYIGNGSVSAYIWGAQLEVGSFPTSYIPTTSAAATRTADIATMTGTNFSSWYNQSEGTLFAEGDSAGGTTPCFASIDDSTVSNRIQLRRAASNTAASLRAVSSGGSIDVTLVNGSDFWVNKQAAAFKSLDQSAVCNGALFTGITSITMPSVTQMMLGNGVSAAPLNGHLRTIDYYNTRLPNATLQALTAPTTSGVAPTLNLDFTKSDRLDPRITFSRASTATYTGSDGLIKTAQAGQPRRDFDPITLQPKGLLIEEQRTNLQTYSEQFDNAVWGKISASISSNTATAPDGTTTADKLVENTSNAQHYIAQAFTVTSGTSYTYSVYVKASGRSRVLLLGATGFTANQAIYNLSSVSTSGISNCTASIQSVGNGWYRCIWTATATSSSSSTFHVFLDNGTTTVYTGDGTSGIYIWGAQLEAGAFATSYIPTTSAQATRAADVATMTGANFSSWYNQTEGTLFAEAASVSSTRPVVAVDDGTMSNRYQLSLASSYTPGFAVVSGGAVSADLYAAAATQNSYVKEAGAYEVNAFAFSANGGSVVTDASGNLPVSVNILRVGAYQSGPILNGWIKRIAYFPKRLSNTELQTLTS